jgi:hypothetical protein
LLAKRSEFAASSQLLALELKWVFRSVRAKRHRDPGIPGRTLADDLKVAWYAPGATMRTRQQLLRALVTNIIADVDAATRARRVYSTPTFTAWN